MDKEVAAFGRLEQGLGTGTVINPAYSGQVFHTQKGLEVREVICKPRTMLGSSGEYCGRGRGPNSEQGTNETIVS